jgi:hypothetical protein
MYCRAGLKIAGLPITQQQGDDHVYSQSKRWFRFAYLFVHTQDCEQRISAVASCLARGNARYAD